MIAPSPRIQLGCRVLVRFDDGEEVTLTLSHEANPRTGIISPTSPLGAALYSASVGDRIRYRAPAGLVVATVLVVDVPAACSAP